MRATSEQKWRIPVDFSLPALQPQLSSTSMLKHWIQEYAAGAAAPMAGALAPACCQFLAVLAI